MGELEWTDEDRDVAKAAWNAVADEYNQWDVISLEEAVSWMLSFARHRIASTAQAADELTALREVLRDARTELWTALNYLTNPAEVTIIRRIDALLAKQGGENV